MKKFFLYMLISIVSHAYSQNCDTQFESEPEISEYSLKSTNIYEDKDLIIDIVFHIIHLEDRSDSFDSSILQGIVDDLNIMFMDAKIEFNLSNINHIYENTFFNHIKNNNDYHLNKYYKEKVINIFVVNKIYKFASGEKKEIGGYAFYPWTSDLKKQGILVIRKSNLKYSTFPHEFGHLFGLYHTHETGAGVELVDGSNCSSAGDLLCDTPADPNLSGLVRSDCYYVGEIIDPNGDLYAPDVNNLMSYSYFSCRNNLTNQQLEKIRSTAVKYYRKYIKNITEIDNGNSEQGFNIFPTISKGFVSIESNKKHDNYRIKVICPDGKIFINRSSTSGLDQVDLSNCKPGVYIINLISGKSVFQKKVIISK